jgi:hypothetical protein
MLGGCTEEGAIPIVPSERICWPEESGRSTLARMPWTLVSSVFDEPSSSAAEWS